MTLISNLTTNLTNNLITNLTGSIDILPITATLQLQLAAFQEGKIKEQLVTVDMSELASNWFDLSVNGNDGIEGTSTRQATYVSSGINDNPALDFSASSAKGFSLPSALFTVPDGDNTVFCVSVSNASSSQQRFFVGHDSDDVQHWGFLYNRGVSDAYSWVNANSFNQLRDSTTGGVTTPHIITATRAGGVRSISINGGTPTTDGLGSSPNDIVALDVGRRPNLTQGLDGLIGEFLI